MQIKSVQTAEETKVAVEKAKSLQKQAMADGDYYVTTKNADAQAYRSQKEGEGLASEIRAERSVFGSDAAFNQYLISKAYKGDVPQINSGALPFLQLPVPAGVTQHTH